MTSRSSPVGRRLRGGIVGGGRGAFIGAIHRMAAELDGQSLVVAGAMSSDPTTAHLSAKDWLLERSYGSYQEMAQAECRRVDGIDFVIVATPNDLHVPVARAFLEAGIHVICDKPLARTLAEGKQLEGVLSRSDCLFALTHAYTGYPMVREARQMVAEGQLGKIRKVLVEYQQDWLMQPLEAGGQKQAAWRTDPARAGLGGSLGDIGTHAANLLEFISGTSIEHLCADLSSWVEGRRLDDDAHVLLRLSNGAKGVMVCSQVACGEANNLNIRVYGTEGSLEWHQEEPNLLLHKTAAGPLRTLRTGAACLSDASRSILRTPAGHPEGYIEAFATIYRAFLNDIRRRANGEAVLSDYPSIAEGLAGLRFVAQAVKSGALGARWVSTDETDASR
jgi:predicted dehydrogenase